MTVTLTKYLETSSSRDRHINKILRDHFLSWPNCSVYCQKGVMWPTCPFALRGTLHGVHDKRRVCFVWCDLRPGYEGMRAGDSSRCSEKIVSNIELRRVHHHHHHHNDGHHYFCCCCRHCHHCRRHRHYYADCKKTKYENIDLCVWVHTVVWPVYSHYFQSKTPVALQAAWYCAANVIWRTHSVTSWIG